MSDLLGVSTDCNSFPSILPQPIRDQQYRFGAALYSMNSPHATIVRELAVSDENRLVDALYERLHFGATNLVCSYHPTLTGLEETKSSPFVHAFGGVDWAIACSHLLTKDLRTHLRFEKQSVFKSLVQDHNISSEEYLFYWLLDQISLKKVASLSDLGWPVLYKLLQSINELGSLNLLLTDGNSLVVYRDQKGLEQLYCMRSCPPHLNREFHFDKMQVRIDALDLHHTFILFTSQQTPLLNDSAIPLFPGQMVVARNGEFIWDSQGIVCVPSSTLTEKNKERLKTAGPCVIQKTYCIPLPAQIPIEGQLEDPYLKICVSSDSPDASPATYSIIHESSYRYTSPIYLSKHLFRLHPVHDLTQAVVRYELITSVGGEVCNFSGAFGNHATLLEVTEPYTELKITSQAIVSVSEAPLLEDYLLHQKLVLPLVWMPWDRIMMQAYLVPLELPESELIELSEYALSFVRRNNNDVFEVLNDINRTIYNDYAYLSGSTTLSTTPFDVYLNRYGVCQDFANLFICLARLLNIPARYRVGYIYTGTDYKNKIQSDASHAWVEVFLPKIGWRGFDPTNGCLAGKNHIRVACGRNYSDAAPTSGTIYKGGGGEQLSTSVRVVRIH